MTAPAPRSLPALPPLESIRNVHIIGICGTAMGTLGAMMRERGFRVSGSDAMAYPPMSDWLRERGLVVQQGYSAGHIPEDAQLVVVGNVARRDNAEVLAAAERALPFVSLPEALALFFFRGRQGLVVTGTHGKTTTTAMAAWLLHATGRDPSMFVGGVTVNFDSNYKLGSGDAFVVEGDEYDTAWFDKVPKFWHYPAAAATINNVEFDHADIYPDLGAIERVFSRFASQVDPEGSLWVNGDDPVAMRCAGAARCGVRTFGLGPGSELRAETLSVGEAGTRVRVWESGAPPIEGVLPTIGVHNVRNFLGAAGLVSAAGVSLGDSLDAARGFRGVRKRQEVKGEAAGVLVIDDFAHHPTAIRETLAALRARWADRRIWAIFEAKSNTSRRAVFQSDFPPAFADADIVILSQPWKKDSLPEEELLSLPRMADDIRALGKDVLLIPSVDEIVPYVVERARSGDLIAGLSGSAFDGLHSRILDALAKRA